jgi:hypothetical protein
MAIPMRLRALMLAPFKWFILRYLDYPESEIDLSGLFVVPRFHF